MTPFDDTAVPGEPLRGSCGWYESSWELLRGLDVCEELPVDAQAAGGWAPEPPSAT